MIRNKKFIPSLLVLCSLLLIGCTQSQEEIVYNGNLSSEEKTQNSTELEPYHYVLDQITPDAYSSVQTLALAPGSVISIIGMESNTPYWDMVQQGAKDAVANLNASLGFKGKDSITLTYNAPASKYGVDEQINILDEELSRFPTSIGMAMLDSHAYEVQFDLALENGIPVVALDSSNAFSNIASTVSTNHTEATMALTQNLANAMNTTGELILITDSTKTTSCIERTQAVCDTISKNYSNITITKTIALDDLDSEKLAMLRVTSPEIVDAATSVLAQQAAEAIAQEATKNSEDDVNASTDVNDTDDTDDINDRDDVVSNDASSVASETFHGSSELIQYLSDELDSITTEDVMEHVLTENPDTAGFLSTTDTGCELLLSQLETNPLPIKPAIASFDISRNLLAALESGTIDSLLLQNPYGIGYATVIACVRAATNSGNQAVVDTGYTLLSTDNLEQCKEQNKIYIN